MVDLIDFALLKYSGDHNVIDFAMLSSHSI